MAKKSDRDPQGFQQNHHQRVDTAPINTCSNHTASQHIPPNCSSILLHDQRKDQNRAGCPVQQILRSDPPWLMTKQPTAQPQDLVPRRQTTAQRHRLQHKHCFFSDPRTHSLPKQPAQQRFSLTLIGTHIRIGEAVDLAIHIHLSLFQRQPVHMQIAAANTQHPQIRLQHHL